MWILEGRRYRCEKKKIELTIWTEFLCSLCGVWLDCMDGVKWVKGSFVFPINSISCSAYGRLPNEPEPVELQIIDPNKSNQLAKSVGFLKFKPVDSEYVHLAFVFDCHVF
jgi:hypothetical protein